jgi:hypothetical protein
MKKLALRLKIFIFRNFNSETVHVTVSEIYTALQCDVASPLQKE